MSVTIEKSAVNRHTERKKGKVSELRQIYGRPFTETQRYGEPSPLWQTLSEHLSVA